MYREVVLERHPTDPYWHIPAEIPDNDGRDLSDIHQDFADIGAVELPRDEWPPIEGRYCQCIVIVYFYCEIENDIECLYAILDLES